MGAAGPLPRLPARLRPSRLADFMAHVNGTTVEIAAPLVLFFSTNKWLTLAAALLMVGFHLFIISTFPLAVPLEWNVVFAYTTVFLFLGFPNWNGYAPWNMSPPWLALVIAAALLFFPVLGNLRPDKVSFLPSMRQYAGNWASAVWAFAPGAEAKLDRVTRSARNQVDQFIAFGYEPQWAEITAQRTIAWRTMHSQGRGLFSLLLTHLPDIDTRTVREGEFICNSLIGFNFGDGHLHDADMIRAVQREAAFEPGECVIAWVESEAFGSGVQHYQLIDAALGVIERGTWKVADAVAEQPWLPNGPIPTQREWSLSGSNPAVRQGPGTRSRSAGMSTAVVVGGGPNGLAAAIALAAEGVSGHRPRGGRRGRRRRPQQRSHPARPAARPLLGDPPDGRRLAVPQQLRPGPLRPVAGAGRRSTASTRSTAAAPACCTARSSRPRPVSAATGRGGSARSATRRREFDALSEDIMGPLLRIPHHPLMLARFGAAHRASRVRVRQVFRTEEGRALFGGVAAHAFRPLHYPMTSAIGMGIITAGHRHGWAVAEGGSQSITNAMVALLADLGGKIETGVRVETASQLPPADVTMFDLAPRRGRRHPRRPSAAPNFARLHQVPAWSGCVQGRLRRRGRRALDEPGRASGGHGARGRQLSPNSPPPSGRSTPGRMPERPFVLVGQQYLADPQRSVGNVHPVWSYAHVPTATPATRPRRSSPRSSGSPPASGTASSGQPSGPPPNSPPTTPTTSAATS